MTTPQKSRPLVRIGDYIIDATVTEAHAFNSDVTEYPVEQGGDITDNIRPKPITVMVEGLVSDTPIGRIADLRNFEGSNSEDFYPSRDALASLLAIRDAREPVTIVTSLQSFDNMVMTQLSVPRDAATGDALRFSATFQQVIFVTNNRTTVRTATPSNGKPRALANKPVGNTKIVQRQVDPYDGAWFDTSAPNPSLGTGATGRWRYGAKQVNGNWQFTDGPFVKTDAQEALDNSALPSEDPVTHQTIPNTGVDFMLLPGVIGGQQ